MITIAHPEPSAQVSQKQQSVLSKNVHFLEVKFSIYLNRRGFIMKGSDQLVHQ